MSPLTKETTDYPPSLGTLKEILPAKVTQCDLDSRFTVGMCLIGSNSELLDLIDSKLCLTYSQISEAAGVSGLEGLLNLLLKKVESLADFGEVLVSFVKL